MVVPETAGLLRSGAFLEGTVGDAAVRVTLAHGQAPAAAGLHVMEAPTSDPTEYVTGLGATGVEVMLAHVGARPLQSHRLIPFLQVTATLRRRAPTARTSTWCSGATRGVGG